MFTLAGLPDIVFTHEHFTDQLHRVGIAFTATVANRHITLVIDPNSGNLNVTRDIYDGNKLFDYSLYYTPRWTNTRGPAHPQPTPISTIHPSQLPTHHS